MYIACCSLIDVFDAETHNIPQQQHSPLQNAVTLTNAAKILFQPELASFGSSCRWNPTRSTKSGTIWPKFNLIVSNVFNYVQLIIQFLLLRAVRHEDWLLGKLTPQGFIPSIFQVHSWAQLGSARAPSSLAPSRHGSPQPETALCQKPSLPRKAGPLRRFETMDFAMEGQGMSRFKVTLKWIPLDSCCQDQDQDISGSPAAKALESKVMKLSLGHAIPSWPRHGQGIQGQGRNFQRQNLPRSTWSCTVGLLGMVENWTFTSESRSESAGCAGCDLDILRRLSDPFGRLCFFSLFRCMDLASCLMQFQSAILGFCMIFPDDPHGHW